MSGPEIDCGLLRPGEFEAWVEGRAGDEVARRVEEHARGGCVACAFLSADVAAIRELERHPETAEEARTADAVLDRVVRGRSRVVPGRFPWVAAAAAVLLAAVLVVPSVLDRGGPEVRVARYEAVEPMPFSAPPVVRGEADPREAWDRAREAYVAGRWGRAALELERVVAADPDTVDGRLYLGIARLFAGRAGEAVAVLDEAGTRARAQGLPDGAPRWYGALARFEAGDDRAARERLRALAEEGGPWADRAASLLRELDGA